jgi:hypothetical protein
MLGAVVLLVFGAVAVSVLYRIGLRNESWRSEK